MIYSVMLCHVISRHDVFRRVVVLPSDVQCLIHSQSDGLRCSSARTHMLDCGFNVPYIEVFASGLAVNFETFYQSTVKIRQQKVHLSP